MPPAVVFRGAMSDGTKEELGSIAAGGSPNLVLFEAPGEPDEAPQSMNEADTLLADGQQTPAPQLSLPPFKISFYEAVAKQLLDDE